MARYFDIEIPDAKILWTEPELLQALAVLEDKYGECFLEKHSSYDGGASYCVNAVKRKDGVYLHPKKEDGFSLFLSNCQALEPQLEQLEAAILRSKPRNLKSGNPRPIKKKKKS